MQNAKVQHKHADENDEECDPDEEIHLGTVSGGRRTADGADRMIRNNAKESGSTGRGNGVRVSLFTVPRPPLTA